MRKTMSDKARDVCNGLNLPEDGIVYIRILKAIKEQARDTRHACAEACLSASNGWLHNQMHPGGKGVTNEQKRNTQVEKRARC